MSSSSLNSLSPVLWKTSVGLGVGAPPLVTGFWEGMGGFGRLLTLPAVLADPLMGQQLADSRMAFMCCSSCEGD